MVTKNWGVLLYLLAALASLSMPFALTALPRTALHLFQQPTHEDLVQAVQSMYGSPLSQAEAPARSVAGTPVGRERSKRATPQRSNP